MAIRPERVALENVGENGGTGIAGDGPNRLRGTIDFIRNTGNLVEVHANCGPARIVHAFSPRAGGDPGFCEGDGIVAHLPPEHCHLYGNEDR